MTIREGAPLPPRSQSLAGNTSVSECMNERERERARERERRGHHRAVSVPPSCSTKESG